MTEIKRGVKMKTSLRKADLHEQSFNASKDNVAKDT